MNDQRYVLEKYNGINSRYDCPACGMHKQFTRYIDLATRQIIHESVGRCNRVDKCGYHLKPGQYFINHPESENKDTFNLPAFNQKPKPKLFSFITDDVFKRSRGQYDQNKLVIYLSSLFGDEATSKLIGNYHLGTSKHWPGSTVFWQIDKQGTIRTGKIMLYDDLTGHRIKKPFNHITWVHSALRMDNYTLCQCFFGEHLLNLRRSSTVAIVESEKTAIIASVYLPAITWLAVGSLTNLTVEKCTILKGRKVILFPDLNGFEKWTRKAREFAHIGTFTVSDLLERIATDLEKQNGLDLADYLVRFDHKEFQIEPERPVVQSRPISQKLSSFRFLDEIEIPVQKPVIFGKQPKTLWDIEQMNNFFDNTAMIDLPVRLDQCSVITNLPLFIQSHMDIIRANNGIETFVPYHQRLLRLQEILSQNKK